MKQHYTPSAHVSAKVLLLLALFSFTTESYSREWSTENKLAGMDSVHLYLPSTPPTLNNKRALMINLHGCGMSNTDMKMHAGWTEVADKFGMIVALPDVPGKGAFSLDCWDYYGSEHTRANKNNDEIIKLAKQLIGRSLLNIDPNQVYITGFSSGGGQANVIACLAPDIFSGIGSFSGPGFGTTATQYNKVPENYSVLTQAKLCKSMAGKNAPHFDTQLYSTVHGNNDTIVDPDFITHGAKIMASIYGASKISSPKVMEQGGTKTIFSDANGPRVSKIFITKLGHKWSTGTGGNSGYFENTMVDYPSYVTQWFFENNRRVKCKRLVNRTCQ